jgi:bleomycin hydrolase
MKYILILLMSCAVITANGQNKKNQGYQFKDTKLIKTTPIESQDRAGTCWSYAAGGWMECEMIRINNNLENLSELFVVRHNYYNKAVKYVRMHGKINFSQGAELNDPLEVIKKYGMVPENQYQGLNYLWPNQDPTHIHGELEAVLTGYLDGVISNRNKTLSSVWKKGIDAILDTYLGKVPESFTYTDGIRYTPKTFAKEVVGINTDDYMYVTSFTHHPFYAPFVLEVPDNSSFGQYQNVPMNELLAIIENSINNGYAVGWSSDVSEKGFQHTKGFAVVPELNIAELDNSERLRWEKLSAKDRKKQMLSFKSIVTEKTITQEMRQQGFDSYATTDDHGMIIVGIAKDQNGTKYFKVKNSWGVNSKYDGYFYASEAYVKYKTISIGVHKDAIPKDIAKKF